VPQQGCVVAHLLRVPVESSPSVSSVSASGCIPQALAVQITRFCSLVHVAVFLYIDIPMGDLGKSGETIDSRCV